MFEDSVTPLLLLHGWARKIALLKILHAAKGLSKGGSRSEVIDPPHAFDMHGL